MSRTDNLYELPKNLPVPLNDGACDHLAGLRLPSVELLSTAGSCHVFLREILKAT
jgi:hypothetical protein